VAEVKPVESCDAVPTSQQPVRLTGKDAFWLHFTLIAGLIVCFGAFAFELARALGGHTFSWMYVFEWPLFAGFAVYMWWNLLHGNDRVRRPSGRPSSARPGVADEELEAWNRYVRRLEADGEPDMAGPV
jgi:multisubunit Na+/H+ antiporter MnhE subunit